eukprot:GHVL01004843.1.p1 GENE.GHVL01004843.1~~GHVL01004843.1.p1  ORF type:complete len:731 (-),score=86.46 GHVL01004843.1:450-2642(-)
MMPMAGLEPARPLSHYPLKIACIPKITQQLLADISEETVDFTPNYDESEIQPKVLPTKLPNILLNGASGIAVGMATNIPPHNIKETLEACILLLEKPESTIDQLMSVLPGPDFPTAGIINGQAGIIEGYRTGRGKIYVRAKVNVETYQVNKARLVEKIAELIKDKKIEGISALRDESDREGMRLVIELKRGENHEVILNNLYGLTQLQISYGINMVALVHGEPKVLNLKQFIAEYISHRREVLTRRTQFRLRKARERVHSLEGLTVALDNVNLIIDLIKKAATPTIAKEQLVMQTWVATTVIDMLSNSDNDSLFSAQIPKKSGLKKGRYQLSLTQAQAILDLKLQRLTGLERDKIVAEYKSLLSSIVDYLDILAKPERLIELIKNELNEMISEYSDARRTEIVATKEDFGILDLIASEDMVVTLSNRGYVKAQPAVQYQSQNRGGRGKSATSMVDTDVICKLLVANTHDNLLCFSSAGKVYWLKVHEIPTAGRGARGKPIINLLPLSETETISALLPIRDYSDQETVFMATKKGMVKQVKLSDFSRPRNMGIIAIDLSESDSLISARLTKNQEEALLITDNGKALKFKVSQVRCMGRAARGVRGIKMSPNQQVISLIILDPNSDILIATEFGYGKRSKAGDFTSHGRGTQGVIAIPANKRNGNVIGALQVTQDDELLLISDSGTLLRLRVRDISRLGRTAQGFTLVNLSKGGKLVAIQRIDEIPDNIIYE